MPVQTNNHKKKEAIANARKAMRKHMDEIIEQIEAVKAERAKHD